MKRVTKLKESSPELLSNEEVYETAVEADRLQELSVLAKTPEGRSLIKLLLEDYRFKAQQLHGMYRTASRDELVSVIAGMEAVWDTAKLLSTAESLLEFLDSELDDALTEQQLGVPCIGLCSTLPRCRGSDTGHTTLWYNIITLGKVNRPQN